MTAVPKISILLTNYNSEKFIEETVKSVLTQTFQDFEFCIVDDCSTDSSYQYLKNIKDPRMSVYKNAQNIGQSRSLNVGLKLTRAPLVARMDADDLAFPNWLEEQEKFIRENPDFAVVSTQAAVVNEHNKLQKIYYSPLKTEEVIIRSLTESPINHVGSIMNKEIVLSVGGYGEAYKIAADYDLWGRLLRAGYKMTSNPKVLIGIRVHSQSLSQIERRKCDVQEIRDIMKKNIHYFSDPAVTEKEIQMVNALFFDEGALSFDEFKEGIEIFNRICTKTKGISPKLIDAWRHNEIRVAFLKRIYFEIQEQNYQAVRKIALLGMERFGSLSSFLGFYLLSLGGNFILIKASIVYKSLIKLKTHFKMKRMRVI